MIRLLVTHEPEGVSVTLMDNGTPFDPLMQPDPDVTLPAEQRNISGPGICMVRKSMDNVRYEYSSHNSKLTLTKYF